MSAKNPTACASDALLLLLLLQSVSFADQAVSVEVNATAVTRLISVNVSSEGMQMLPGYEYASDLIFDWAVPDSALKGITEPKVDVFVKVRVEGNDSRFYFKDDGVRRNETMFVLFCSVSGVSCGNGSKLAHAVKLYTTLADPSSANGSGTLSVMASLKPFSEFEPIYTESLNLGEQVEMLKSRLASMNLSETNLTVLNESLDNVSQMVSSYNIDEAKAKLEEIKPALGVASHPLNDLSFSLSFLGLGFNSLLGDIPYLLAFILGAVIFVVAVLCKLRSGSRIAIGLVSLIAVAAAFMKLVDAPLLIGGELVLAALPLAVICFWRRNSKSKASYRMSDDWGE